MKIIATITVQFSPRISFPEFQKIGEKYGCEITLSKRKIYRISGTPIDLFWLGSALNYECDMIYQKSKKR